MVLLPEALFLHLRPSLRTIAVASVCLAALLQLVLRGGLGRPAAAITATTTSFFTAGVPDEGTEARIICNSEEAQTFAFVSAAYVLIHSSLTASLALWHLNIEIHRRSSSYQRHMGVPPCSSYR